MMKRTMTAKLAGEEIELAATFKAASEIGQRVADPLFIAREMALTSMLESQGVERDPKFRFTVENIGAVLHIGAKAAGDKRSLADFQELAFAAGFFASLVVARDYVNLICIPQTEELAPEGGDAPGE